MAKRHETHLQFAQRLAPRIEGLSRMCIIAGIVGTLPVNPELPQ